MSSDCSWRPSSVNDQSRRRRLRGTRRAGFQRPRQDFRSQSGIVVPSKRVRQQPSRAQSCHRLFNLEFVGCGLVGRSIFSGLVVARQNQAVGRYLCVRRNCPSASHQRPWRPFVRLGSRRLRTRLPWSQHCRSGPSLPTSTRPCRRLWQAQSTPRVSALWPASWSGSHRQSARPRNAADKENGSVCPEPGRSLPRSSAAVRRQSNRLRTPGGSPGARDAGSSEGFDASTCIPDSSPLWKTPLDSNLGRIGKDRSGPVSRVLSRAAISLGRRLPAASSNLPGRICGPDQLATVARRFSLFGLAPGGVCLARLVTRPAGELLPHRFTLTAAATDESATASRRFAFCCTFPGLAAGGRYPPPCPVEPGLSSPKSTAPERSPTSQRPLGPLRPCLIIVQYRRAICANGRHTLRQSRFSPRKNSLQFRKLKDFPQLVRFLITTATQVISEGPLK